MCRPWTSSIVFIIAVLAACSAPERLSSPSAGTLQVTDAKVVSSAAYSPADLGLLAGDHESYGWSVNDAGYVIIQSNLYTTTGTQIEPHWYIKSGSTITRFPEPSSRSIGGGATAFVGTTIGGAEPARWTFTPSGGFSNRVPLDTVGGYGGGPFSFNAAGDAIGGGVVIWKVDGTTIAVSNPDPSSYYSSQGKDINESGDAVMNYYGIYTPGVSVLPDRGYLRLADGSMIAIPPLGGDRSTYVYGVSERIDGLVYVAAVSDRDDGYFKAMRVAIDVASHAIVGVEIGSAQTTPEGMSDDGTIAGTIHNNSLSAYVWKRGGAMTTLKVPKSGSSPRVWRMSGNGRYIAGDAKFGTYRHAVLWSAQ